MVGAEVGAAWPAPRKPRGACAIVIRCSLEGPAMKSRNIAWCLSLALLAGPFRASAEGPSAPADANPDRFITLGTMGGPIPDARRSQPANAIVSGPDVYLVDVGDGAAEQLAKARLGVPQIKAILLSHLHFDHTGGLAAVLGLRYQTKVPGKVAIYGPPGTRALVEGVVRSMEPAAAAGYGIPGEPAARPRDIVEVVELTDRSAFALGPLQVSARQNTHYSFPPGSAHDKAFKSLAFRFDTPGRSIVYTGDTGPSEAVEELAKGADLLISEMIDVDRTVAAVRRNTPNMTAKAREGLMQHLSTHHLTPEQVGALASNAGVKSVIVTHFVAPTATATDLLGYEERIGTLFKGPVVIANDLDSF